MSLSIVFLSGAWRYWIIKASVLIPKTIQKLIIRSNILDSMTEETFFPTIWKQLENRLQEIENRHHYLSYLIEKRFANEKLLQLELMHIISQNPEVADYLPEKLYITGGNEKCDFWFGMKSGIEFWVEIKTRPTNYRKPRHAKAITNGVSQVIEDIRRLRQMRGRDLHRLILFAFYPLYSDSYRTFDSVHLHRISQEVGKAITSPKIKIRIGPADFNVYSAEV